MTLMSEAERKVCEALDLAPHVLLIIKDAHAKSVAPNLADDAVLLAVLLQERVDEARALIAELVEQNVPAEFQTEWDKQAIAWLEESR